MCRRPVADLAAPRDYDLTLLRAAVAGDEHAFGRLLEPFHRGLLTQCYRMLGALHDAEDAVQETSLRAWKGLPRFHGRSMLGTWLHRIAINVCLTAIERRDRRLLPVEFGPAWEAHAYTDRREPEALWIGPLPDSPEDSAQDRERLELAFVAALQHLLPNQRAVLIMREALGLSAQEIAAQVGTSVAAVNSSLQRARQTVAERIPEPSQRATLAALGDPGQQRLVKQYIAAMERADVPALLALLTDDASWSMPPHPSWYQGAEAIGAFLSEQALPPGWRHLPTSANGQLAVACYSWQPEAGAYVAHVIDVLTVRGQRISAVCGFVMPELFARFGLPLTVPEWPARVPRAPVGTDA